MGWCGPGKDSFKGWGNILLEGHEEAQRGQQQVPSREHGRGGRLGGALTLTWPGWTRTCLPGKTGGVPGSECTETRLDMEGARRGRRLAPAWMMEPKVPGHRYEPGGGEGHAGLAAPSWAITQASGGISLGSCYHNPHPAGRTARAQGGGAM